MGGAGSPRLTSEDDAGAWGAGVGGAYTAGLGAGGGGAATLGATTAGAACGGAMTWGAGIGGGATICGGAIIAPAMPIQGAAYIGGNGAIAIAIGQDTACW
jgi:hypothetical protein